MTYPPFPHFPFPILSFLAHSFLPPFPLPIPFIHPHCTVSYVLSANVYAIFFGMGDDYSVNLYDGVSYLK